MEEMDSILQLIQKTQTLLTHRHNMVGWYDTTKNQEKKCIFNLYQKQENLLLDGIGMHLC